MVSCWWSSLDATLHGCAPWNGHHVEEVEQYTGPVSCKWFDISPNDPSCWRVVCDHYHSSVQKTKIGLSHLCKTVATTGARLCWCWWFSMGRNSGMSMLLVFNVWTNVLLWWYTNTNVCQQWIDCTYLWFSEVITFTATFDAGQIHTLVLLHSRLQHPPPPMTPSVFVLEMWTPGTF